MPEGTDREETLKKIASRDSEVIPRFGPRDELFQAEWDRRFLLEELERMTQMTEAFKGAAANLAQSGLAERDALRKVIALLYEEKDCA